MTTWKKLGDFLPLFIVCGGFVFGLLFDRIVLRRLRRLATKTPWEGDEIILHSLRHLAVYLFTLASAYYAVVTSPLKRATQAEIKQVLQIAFIFVGIVFLARLAVGFIGLYARRSEGLARTTTIFTTMTRVVVYSIGALIMLQALNISITPILTALGVGGLAIALALQDTLANLFAGLHILASRPVRPGDYIRLESGQEGYVCDISWRNTTIRGLANHMVVIPNSKLASAIIVNFNQPDKEIGISVPVAVAYESDLALVEELARETGLRVMQEVEGGVPTFEPSVRFQTIGENGVQLSVNLRAREFSTQYLLRHEFIKRLHTRLREAGIAIPPPPWRSVPPSS